VPTYQYACTECGHAFEQFQSFTDDALTVCPVCEGRLRKVFNAVGVVFKGSGFYRTDSRQDGPKNGSSGEKSGSGSGGDSGTTGSKEPSKSTGSKESPAASGSTGTTSTSSPSTSGSTSAA
jgi:putative FmdB family regulatory protein